MVTALAASGKRWHTERSCDTLETQLKSLSIREVRSQIPRLEEILASEGELVITRRGRPIARLLPARTEAKLPSHAGLRSRMKRLTEGSEALVRQDRDER